MITVLGFDDANSLSRVKTVTKIFLSRFYNLFSPLCVVTVKLFTKAAEAPTPSITSVDSESLLAARVLVVDDRRDIRFLSKLILTRAGASVNEAEAGPLGLDFVRERLAAGNLPNLILLDMQTRCKAT